MAIEIFGSPQAGVNYIERPGAYAILRNPLKQIALVQTNFGFFLPGGGLNDGETPELGLQREVLEEIGLEVRNLRLFAEARQYVISRFYGQAFLKHGYFYVADWVRSHGKWQKDHELVWSTNDSAIQQVTHDFQKWAIQKSLGF